MHAALWTLMVVVSAGQPTPAPTDQANVAPTYSTNEGAVPGCADCAAGTGCALHGVAGKKGWLADWFGSMPQTCYAPHFGCYPGSARTIHRYPAFHGYYYREPYNYRHVFDYPWHAAPHEPVGYFTYQAEQTGEEGTVPAPDGAISPQGAMEPTPAPVPASRSSQTRVPAGAAPKLLNR